MPRTVWPTHELSYILTQAETKPITVTCGSARDARGLRAALRRFIRKVNGPDVRIELSDTRLIVSMIEHVPIVVED